MKQRLVPNTTTPILSYGWSIGTSMAIHVAAERHVAGLILQAPPATAQEMMRWSSKHDVPWYGRGVVKIKADPEVDVRLSRSGALNKTLTTRPQIGAGCLFRNDETHAGPVFPDPAFPQRPFGGPALRRRLSSRLAGKLSGSPCTYVTENDLPDRGPLARPAARFRYVFVRSLRSGQGSASTRSGFDSTRLASLSCWPLRCRFLL